MLQYGLYSLVEYGCLESQSVSFSKHLECSEMRAFVFTIKNITTVFIDAITDLRPVKVNNESKSHISKYVQHILRLKTSYMQSQIQKQEGQHF